MKVNFSKAKNLISTCVLKGSKVASMLFGQILMSTSENHNNIHLLYFSKSIKKDISEAKIILSRFQHGQQLQLFETLSNRFIVGMKFWFGIYSLFQAFQCDYNYEILFQEVINSNEPYWIEQLLFLQKLLPQNFKFHYSISPLMVNDQIDDFVIFGAGIFKSIPYSSFQIEREMKFFIRQFQKYTDQIFWMEQARLKSKTYSIFLMKSKILDIDEQISCLKGQISLYEFQSNYINMNINTQLKESQTLKDQIDLLNEEKMQLSKGNNFNYFESYQQQLDDEVKNINDEMNQNKKENDQKYLELVQILNTFKK